MGDFKVVRPGIDGKLRTISLVANGDIEEGDAVTITAGKAVKVADDGAAVAAIALGDVADTATGIFARLTSGVIVEGVDKDTCVVGDAVGVNVTTAVQTFEKGGSYQTFRVVKVTADLALQCEALDATIG